MLTDLLATWVTQYKLYEMYLNIQESEREAFLKKLEEVSPNGHLILKDAIDYSEGNLNNN